MEFTAQALAHYVILGIFALVVPAGAVIFWKARHKDAPLSAAFTGAGAFFLFVCVLESLLHRVMIPLVQGNTVALVIYGALAAGVFEETARFITFKTILRKKTAPETSVMYGLGHGGFEVLFIFGTTVISALSIAIMCDAMGTEAFVEMTANGSEEVKAAALAQIEYYANVTLATTPLALIERIVAMTLHTALSVIVFEGAHGKGRLWLYPAAVLVHAAVDVPAVLCQQAVIPIWLSEVLMAVVAAGAAIWAWRLYKSMKQRVAA